MVNGAVGQPLPSRHWRDAARMDVAEAEAVLVRLKDDHPYPAMVIDRILIDVQRAHGHAEVNRLIDACALTRRFGIRKVWPDRLP
jgi:hypothetical protein